MFQFKFYLLFVLIMMCRLDNSLSIKQNHCIFPHRDNNLGSFAENVIEFNPPSCSDYSSEECAKEYLCEYDRVMSNNVRLEGKAYYQFGINMTKETENFQSETTKLTIPVSYKAVEFGKNFVNHSFSPFVNRMLKKITWNILPKNENDLKTITDLSIKLNSLYGNAQACPKGSDCLEKGQNAVEQFMEKERDYDKLSNVWEAWSKATGPNIVSTYVEYVSALNAGARENGEKDAGHFEWMKDMEDSTFDSWLLDLYEEIKPLFEQLHAYVRHRLLQKYPGKFDKKGPIPAHIFGNPWAQQWDKIKDLVLPFPNVSSINVDDKLSKLSIMDMVKLAEEFFTSLGLSPMTDDFWKYSVFEKPDNVLMQCHASAHDMHNGKDFRIAMCTQQDQHYLYTIHHEMGHIQYFMSYAHWLYSFRESANSGFHETVGDAVALSVNTPEHLKKINLISDVPTNEEYDLNVLMEVGLEKVAFLPFALTTDMWRWRAFNGTYTQETFNKGWWDLRMKYHGVMPPVKRQKGDFDPFAKYHVSINVPYIRYFMSLLLQFQFYESMCDASGYRGPLHRCDFYQSKPAGDLLKKMMEMGASEPWPEALKAITGQGKIKAKSLLRYFRPLHDWLANENLRLKIPVGWTIPDNVVE